MNLKNRIIQLLFAVLLFAGNSCSKVDKKISVKEFNKTIIDSLIPKKNGSYTSYIIRIKGHTNDSIYLKPCESCYRFFVTGNAIDEKLIFDYYGEFKQTFEFNPYKATAGELDIEFSIE